MAKARVLLRILCALLWLLGTANAAPSAKVVVLQGTMIEWEAGSRVLLAELEATGFKVLIQTTTASTPGQLIDELRVAGASEDCGAVVVFGEPPTPRAYVWLPEREDLVQVEAPFDAASVAPQVLALRVVELLRTRWAPVAPKRRASPPPAEPAPTSRSIAWLALGPEFSFGSGQGPLQFAAGGNLRFLKHILLELSGSTSLVPDESPSALGTIELRKTRLSLHPLFTFTPAEVPIDAAVGVGGGVVFVAARGRVESTRQQVVGLEANEVVGQSSVRARASLHSGPLAAMVMAEFSWFFTRLTFQADDQRLLSVNGAGIFVAGGLAWAN